jgi:hypothetical protein
MDTLDAHINAEDVAQVARMKCLLELLNVLALLGLDRWMRPLKTREKQHDTSAVRPVPFIAPLKRSAAHDPEAAAKITTAPACAASDQVLKFIRGAGGSHSRNVGAFQTVL